MIPIGQSAAKVTSWRNHGAAICYVTASRKAANVRRSEEALRRWGFPEGILLSRKNGESYAAIAVGAKLDVIVEDDCESIGGANEMIHPNLPGSAKQLIAAVVVREFEGVDGLPDDPELMVRVQL